MLFHLLLLLPFTQALWINTNNLTTIQPVTGIIADGLLDYYEGDKYGGAVGMFSAPYYWWQAGGAIGSLIDFWHFMENDTYEELVYDALLHQAGDDWNYIPLNQSTTEGNDDQGFWGVAVMSAVERNFTNPPDDLPQWLYLAQAVFNTMANRWDMTSCGGGLRWQIFQWNSGFNYKNSVSTGCLFHIGARLARYTGNDSYVDWANTVYDWMHSVNLIVEGEYYMVYDGAYVDDNCSAPVALQWTYNVGLMLSGCAYLYNYTEEPIWLNRTLGMLKGAQLFVNMSELIMYEAACQPSDSCNNDQRSFKAYFARFLGMTAQLVPQTMDDIYSIFVQSANGASWSCSGGSDGVTCGLDWGYQGWDGYYGLGEQMAALEVIQNLMVKDRPAPYTAETGGSSKGDGAAGTQTTTTAVAALDIDRGDQAGAGIITAVIGISIIAAGLWLVI